MAIRLILVDDHEVVRSGLRMLLENERDVEIVGEFGVAQDALEALPELKPDVVLMDIVLPKIDGITTIKKILKFDSNAYIIAISALYKTEQINKVMNAGAKDYLTKPFNIDDLVEALEKGLSELKKSKKILKNNAERKSCFYK